MGLQDGVMVELKNGSTYAIPNGFLYDKKNDTIKRSMKLIKICPHCKNDTFTINDFNDFVCEKCKCEYEVHELKVKIIELEENYEMCCRNGIE